MDCVTPYWFQMGAVMATAVLGCEPTGSDNASGKRQNCLFRVTSNYPFAKLMEMYPQDACDKIFQATSDKILHFYNFMRALLRQETILSLVARFVAPCAFTPLDGAKSCTSRVYACETFIDIHGH